MSDSKGSGGDPSMDDILASIRKIISDDETRAQANGAAPAPSQPAEPGPSSVPPPAKRDDVLLLTDLVEEPKGGSSSLARPPEKTDPTSAGPVAQSQAAPVAAAQPGKPLPSATDGMRPSAVEPPAKQSAPERTLMEPGAAGLAASAFDRLSQAVQATVPQPRAADPGPSVGANGRNLEDIVKELLQPMLKEWMDKNLPIVVERLVEREIVRLTRR